MIKRFVPIAMLSAAIFGFASCKNGGSVKKVKGIEYTIVKDAQGKNAVVGDFIELNVKAYVDTNGKGGRVDLGDSRKDNNGKPVNIPVQETKESAQWQSVLPFLSAGDSAVVNIYCDTILKNIPPDQQQMVPKWLKKGNKITFEISVVAVKSKADAEKEAQQKTAAQAQTDDQQLQEYFTKNNLKAEKTSSGLYYIISNEGAGEKIAAGQTVSMNYTGKLMNGNKFDSNTDSAFHHMEPFKFHAGAHEVIPGWDEGVMLLKKGAKATFFVPSTLGYGDRAAGPMLPPNSILIFDVEVLDVVSGK